MRILSENNALLGGNTFELDHQSDLEENALMRAAAPHKGGDPAPFSAHVLSFFTGAGFLDLGFENADFDVVWRNEYSKQFIKGFEYAMQAMGKTSKITNSHSIVDVGPNQIAEEAFRGHPRPNIVGMIGGPPCPDFSVGGKNRGHTGDHGKLSQVYVSRIAEIGPTFFVFENVPGLLRTKKHRIFLTQIIEQLSEKYYLDINILCALDYGVPQDRERVFLVGFQKKWLKENAPNSWIKSNSLGSLPKDSTCIDYMLNHHWFPWGLKKRFEHAKTQFDWPTECAFRSSPKKPAGIPDELMVERLLCRIEETSNLPNGEDHFIPYSRRFTEVAEGDVSRKSFKRLHRWRYSPAAAYGNNEVHLHPTQPRRLTVREAMRIQTVPDNYALPPEMPLSHKFKTIGNGVPVKLAEALAFSIRAVLEGVLWKSSI